MDQSPNGVQQVELLPDTLLRPEFTPQEAQTCINFLNSIVLQGTSQQLAPLWEMRDRIVAKIMQAARDAAEDQGGV